MTAALIALVLAAPATPTSLTLKYEGGQEGGPRERVTLRVQGPRLRVDVASPRLTVVLDDAKQRLTFTDQKPGACYELPYAQRTELQVLAMRRDDESEHMRYESLSKGRS